MRTCNYSYWKRVSPNAILDLYSCLIQSISCGISKQRTAQGNFSHRWLIFKQKHGKSKGNLATVHAINTRRKVQLQVGSYSSLKLESSHCRIRLTFLYDTPDIPKCDPQLLARVLKCIIKHL